MSKRLTTEALEAIRKRAEAATTGPWYTAHTFDGQWIIKENGDIISGTVSRDDDATFIIHSREDIPALLSEVERLRSYISRIPVNCVFCGVTYQADFEREVGLYNCEGCDGDDE